MHIYLNGQRISDVFDLRNKGGRQWSFVCRPPIFIADENYKIYPCDGKPMRIMISKLVSDAIQSHIEAIEL